MLDYHWFIFVLLVWDMFWPGTLSVAGVRVKRGGAEKPRGEVFGTAVCSNAVRLAEARPRELSSQTDQFDQEQ